MSKRSEFWESVYAVDADAITWPSDPVSRSALAGRVVGATVIGAIEHVLQTALAKIEGQAPEPGDDYLRNQRDVEILQTLDEAQQDVVRRLLHRTAYAAGYWPLAKLRSLPDLAVDVVLLPVDKNHDELPPSVLNDTCDLHSHLLEWVDDFADILPNED